MAKRGYTREMLQPQCNVPTIENRKKIMFYFHSARELLLQGDWYYKEGNLATSYVYFKRFLYLAVREMPNHQAYSSNSYSDDRNWLEKERDRVFPLLETISAQLDSADELAARAEAAAAAAAAGAAAAASTGHHPPPTTYPSAPPQPAREGWWDDIPEAPTGLPSPYYAGMPAGIPGGMPPSQPLPPPNAPGQYLLPPPMPPPYSVGGPPPLPASNVADPQLGWGGGVSGPIYGGGGVGVGAGVGLGAGMGVGGGLALHDAFSTLSFEQSAPAGGYYPNVGTPGSHQERPSMRPKESAIGAFSMKRKLVLPSTLVGEFEKIARPNTDRPPDGIETCGILAGRLSHNVLKMTTLIIPKQTGTSDSCETTDETALFNYMLANKLITLGWIHTHPKQDCFLSSVDLHTHCGYQLMLPEAVAVVYAPCDNRKRVGVFRLTQPEGMKLIQQCTLKGFHVHPDGVTIYENADLMWSPVSIDVVDIR